METWSGTSLHRGWAPFHLPLAASGALWSISVIWAALAVSRQVPGMNHCLQQMLSLCPSSAEPWGKIGPGAWVRVSSTRWKVLLVSVTLQVCSLEELFLSCFKSLASLLWQKGKTSTPDQRGTCHSSSPWAACCSSDCWATWASCWRPGSVPTALRQAEHMENLCESSQCHAGEAPAMTERNQAHQPWGIDHSGVPFVVVNAIASYSDIRC